MIAGGSSQSDVLTKGSTSRDNILGVLRGTTVTPCRWAEATVDTTAPARMRRGPRPIGYADSVDQQPATRDPSVSSFVDCAGGAPGGTATTRAISQVPR